MSGKSDYLELKILDHLLGGATYSQPATVYVALCLAVPTDTGISSEVSVGDYTRLAVGNTSSDGSWSAASSGQKKNAKEFSYKQATANWGTVQGFAIMDAVTAGNLLYWGSLDTQKSISTGDTAKFALDDIVISED